MSSYPKNTKETGKNVVKHISSVFTKNKKHCREKNLKKTTPPSATKAPAPPSPNLSKNCNWDPSKTQMRLVRKRKEQMGFWWRWKCFTKRRRRQQKCCFVEERREEKRRSFQQNQKGQEKQKWVVLSSFFFKKVEGKRNPIPTQHPSPLQPTKYYKQQPRPLHHHSQTLLHRKEGRFFISFLFSSQILSSFLFPNSLFFSLLFPKTTSNLSFLHKRKNNFFSSLSKKKKQISHTLPNSCAFFSAIKWVYVWRAFLWLICVPSKLLPVI